MQTVETQDMIQGLKDLLDALIAKHETLLGVIKEERTAIVHNDLDGLDRAGKGKMVHQGTIMQLEEDRKKILSSLCPQIGLSAQGVTLSALIDNVPDAAKVILAEKQTILRKLLRKVQISHDANKLLIQRTLAFREKLFIRLFDISQETGVYGPSGAGEQVQRVSLIDSKA